MTGQKSNSKVVDVDGLIERLESVPYCYMPAKPDPNDETRPEMIIMDPEKVATSLKLNRINLEARNAAWRVRIDQGVLYIEERIHD